MGSAPKMWEFATFYDSKIKTWRFWTNVFNNVTLCSIIMSKPNNELRH